MYVDEFPNCCGIACFCDFGYTKVTGGNYGTESDGKNQWGRQVPPTKEQIREWVAEQIKDQRRYGMLAVAFNEEQKEELGSILTDAGFKLVSEGLNSHHTSKVFLYTLCNTEFMENEEYDDYYEDEEEV